MKKVEISCLSCISSHIVYQKTMLVICAWILSGGRVKTFQQSMKILLRWAWKEEGEKNSRERNFDCIVSAKWKRTIYPWNRRSIIIPRQCSIQSHGRLFHFEESISCRGLSSLPSLRDTVYWWHGYVQSIRASIQE